MCQTHVTHAGGRCFCFNEHHSHADRPQLPAPEAFSSLDLHFAHFWTIFPLVSRMSLFVHVFLLSAFEIRSKASLSHGRGILQTYACVRGTRGDRGSHRSLGTASARREGRCPPAPPARDGPPERPCAHWARDEGLWGKGG